MPLLRHQHPHQLCQRRETGREADTGHESAAVGYHEILPQINSKKNQTKTMDLSSRGEKDNGRRGQPKEQNDLLKGPLPFFYG